MPAWSRAMILVTLICVLIPRGVELQLGTIMIDFSRVALTLFSIVAAVQLLSGAVTIQITIADSFMFMHIGIITFSAVYHGGFGDGLENAIAVLVDMGLAYFVARVAVHNLHCYRYCVRILLMIAAISAIFGLIELFTGHSIIRTAYHVVFPKIKHLYLYEKRLSLYRSIATFRHWILFGLYCATTFTLAVCLKPNNLKMGRTFYKGCLVLCVAGVFASLSSGPWLAFTLCIFLLAYSRVMKHIGSRWKLILFATGSCFLLLSVVSNRGPIKLAIDYLTFDARNGYIRLAMWKSVFAVMADYWPLGWGWGADWPHHEWYIWSSIDSFFAVWLVRSGIFAVLSIIAFLAYSWYRLANIMSRKQFAAGREAKGWILATVCLFVAAITVHIFGNLNFTTYFLLGAGQVLFTACGPRLHCRGIRKIPTGSRVSKQDSTL